jgi:hypothetical protein
MFGYVKPYVPFLRVKDYEFYKATYCGVCRAMKKHTGALSNVGLSYDSVILALVRMLFIPDSEISAEKKRCIAHPLKRKTMLAENSALVYTARAFALLTYYKLLDDISDEGAGRKMLAKTVRPIYKRARKKAARVDLSAVISEKLSEISKLESAGERSVDAPANLFGELLGTLFSNDLSKREQTVVYEFGYHLGKFIYCADAAEDYEEDRKTGKYNPYVLIYDRKELSAQNKQNIKTALILECKMMENAVNLLPFGSRLTIENIIKNLIYDGLVKRIEFLGE